MGADASVPLYTLHYTDGDGDVLGIAPTGPEDTEEPCVSFEIGDGSGTDEPKIAHVPTSQVPHVIHAIRSAANLSERSHRS